HAPVFPRRAGATPGSSRPEGVCPGSSNREGARRGPADHHMKQLEAVEATDPRFDELVRTMTEKLRHHAHDEEADQFPKLREHVPHDELVRLEKKVEAAKGVAPTRPHPSAPNTELFHELVWARAWGWRPAPGPDLPPQQLTSPGWRPPRGP